jgi:hypothetical protein
MFVVMGWQKEGLAIPCFSEVLGADDEDTKLGCDRRRVVDNINRNGPWHEAIEYTSWNIYCYKKGKSCQSSD